MLSAHRNRIFSDYSIFDIFEKFLMFELSCRSRKNNCANTLTVLSFFSASWDVAMVGIVPGMVAVVLSWETILMDD